MVARRDRILHGRQIQAGSLYFPQARTACACSPPAGLAARPWLARTPPRPGGSRGNRRDVSRRRVRLPAWTIVADRPGARAIGADAPDHSAAGGATLLVQIARARWFTPDSLAAPLLTPGRRLRHGHHRVPGAQRSRPASTLAPAVKAQTAVDTPIGVYQLEWGSSIRYYADRRVLALPDPDARCARSSAPGRTHTCSCCEGTRSRSATRARSDEVAAAEAIVGNTGRYLRRAGVGRRDGCQPPQARAAEAPHGLGPSAGRLSRTATKAAGEDATASPGLAPLASLRFSPRYHAARRFC